MQVPNTSGPCKADKVGYLHLIIRTFLGWTCHRWQLGMYITALLPCEVCRGPIQKRRRKLGTSHVSLLLPCAAIDLIGGYLALFHARVGPTGSADKEEH